MPSEQPGNQFEVEFPGEWPTCPHCASRTRIAVARLRRRNVGFYCGGPDMHRLPWTTDAGSTDAWVPPEVFWPGGDFEGLLPTYYLGVPKQKDPTRRYEISARRNHFIQNEQPACARCGVPPMRDWYDRGKLLDWLRERNGSEFGDLLAVVNATQPRPKRSTWYEYLVRHHIELVVRINFRIQDSYLQPDLSIPKSVLAALWPAWSPQMRRVAVNTLAFGLCRPCSTGKTPRLPAPDQLLRCHYELNYGGAIDAAKADLATWSPLLRVLQSVEEYRAAVSGLDAAP
jgi:hypothetical protein